jgi:hypothetical protein
MIRIACSPDSSESPARRRLSEFDVVLKDFKSLRNNVGAVDRARLDAHADGVSDLEKRLEQLGGASCAGAVAPGPDIQADQREDAPPLLHDVMSRMLAPALACDLTHVFSCTFSLPAAHVYYRHLGPDFNRSFHEDIMHLVDGIDGGYDLVSKGVTYAMESLAVTLGHLQSAAPSILDETAILATSDVSSGWDHGMADFPALVLGRGGKLRGDLHIAAGQQQRNLTDVHLTLFQNEGLPVTETGLATLRSTSDITELLA